MLQQDALKGTGCWPGVHDWQRQKGRLRGRKSVGPSRSRLVDGEALTRKWGQLAEVDLGSGWEMPHLDQALIALHKGMQPPV